MGLSVLGGTWVGVTWSYGWVGLSVLGGTWVSVTWSYGWDLGGWDLVI